jgi:hypothetical protein
VYTEFMLFKTTTNRGNFFPLLALMGRGFEDIVLDVSCEGINKRGGSATMSIFMVLVPDSCLACHYLGFQTYRVGNHRPSRRKHVNRARLAAY